jgi:hypothetical protein
MEPDSNAKNLRMPSPKKYDSKDDVDVFMNFIKGVLRYMFINNYTGPDMDF